MILIQTILTAAVLLLTTISGFAESKDFTFIQLTDGHMEKGAVYLSSTIAEINKLTPAPEFAVFTGDFANYGTVREFDKYAQIMDGLNYKYYTVLGNHETQNNDVGYYTYQQRYGSPYHSFDHNGIHFVLLNTGVSSTGAGFITAAQLEWLRSDLQKIGTQMPVFLFSHHLPTDRGIGNNVEVYQVIKDYNIRAWFTGHLHATRHFIWNGIHVLVTKDTLTCGYRIIQVKGDKVFTYNKEVDKPESPDKVVIGLYTKKSAPEYELISPGYQVDTATSITCAVKFSTLTLTAVKASLRAKVDRDTTYTLVYSTITQLWQQNIPVIQGNHTLIIQMVLTEKTTFYSGNVVSTGTIGYIWEKSYNFTVGDNAVAWKYATGDMVISAPVVENGNVYCGSADGTMYCLSASTGGVKWKYATNGIISGDPVIYKDKLIFGSHDGNVYVLDKTAGALYWKYTSTVPVYSTPVVAESKDGDFNNTRIVVAHGNGLIAGLSFTDGTVLWRYNTKYAVSICPAYNRENGTVYFGGWDGYTRGISVSTGGVVWSRRIYRGMWGAPGSNSPVIDGDKLYLNDIGKVYALTLSSGSTVWSSTVTHSTSKPVIYGDKVIVCSSDNKVQAYDKSTGALLWRVQAKHGIHRAQPVIYNDYLVISTSWGTVHIMNPDTGKIVYNYQLSDYQVTSTPCIMSGKLYIGSSDKNVYAVELDRIMK
ncbi:MAG: PQQ-binding-like beta-propeller repeat protein [Elusimicrobiota bacterium]